MEDNVLDVRMLGGFTLGREGVVLELSSRSRKLYLLLAYLILSRGRDVPYKELSGLLWPGQQPDASTWGALKALLHRARVFLSGLGEGTGKLLLNQGSLCRWNPDVPLTVDAEEFTRLCREGDADESARLSRWSEALTLYRGHFLPAADCPWAEEYRDALHKLWLRTLPGVLSRLAREEKWEQAASLAEGGLSLEPCREDLCRARMEALLRLERRQQAVEVYETFQERLLSHRGVLPSDGLRELCRAARDDPEAQVFTPANLLDRLQEPPASGALLCAFDFFRVLCFSLIRLAQRGKQPLCTALLTLSGDSLPRHSLERAMNHLQDVILNSLRRGDAVSRCSASQFLLLLPQAGCEDTKMVCRRVCRAFSRQFPHAPVKLEFAVLPLHQA